MNILEQMEAKLRAALAPQALKVRDDSGAHYGHDGAREGHVSHVAILVVAEAFAGKPRIARSRMVFEALREEIPQVHALTQVKTLTPEEWAPPPP